MARVLIAHSAKLDLEEIWQYIADDNSEAADNFIVVLSEKFYLLSENIGIGRDRSDLVPNLQVFPHKNYLIFYFPVEAGVEIFRVIHCSRDIENVFEKIADY